jgi:hypothetical protein
VNKLSGTWLTNYPVKHVGELTLAQASALLSGWDQKNKGFDIWVEELKTPLRVVIDYPLERPVVMEIGNGGKGYLTFGEFLWHVAKQYERIYEDPEVYGVWGHSIDDLVFERVTVNKNGETHISVGS